MAERDTHVLHKAMTLYLPDHADRVQVAKLVDAMCRLNGILIAIEMVTDGDSRPLASAFAAPRDVAPNGRTYRQENQ